MDSTKLKCAYVEVQYYTKQGNIRITKICYTDKDLHFDEITNNEERIRSFDELASYTEKT